MTDISGPNFSPVHIMTAWAHWSRSTYTSRNGAIWFFWIINSRRKSGRSGIDEGKAGNMNRHDYERFNRLYVAMRRVIGRKAAYTLAAMLA